MAKYNDYMSWYFGDHVNNMMTRKALLLLSLMLCSWG